MDWNENNYYHCKTPSVLAQPTVTSQKTTLPQQKSMLEIGSRRSCIGDWPFQTKAEGNATLPRKNEGVKSNTPQRHCILKEE